MSKAAEAEFLATQDRIRRGADVGSDLRPRFDPKDRADVREAFAQGRDPADYHQSLEYHGFSYIPPHRLGPERNGKMPVEGKWAHYGLRFAFTESDLITQFRSPEDFDVFIRRHKLIRRLARRGLTLKDTKPWRRR